MSKSAPLHYTADHLSVDTTAAGAQQLVEFVTQAKTYKLVESLALVYENADGTFTAVNGLIELLYAPSRDRAAERVPLWRAPTDKNSFLPMVNGVGDDGLGRVVVGRPPVIINQEDRLIIGLAGFPAGKRLLVRGRYWEVGTLDELYQYYVGLSG